MSVRPFTVFQDIPSRDAPPHDDHPRALPTDTTATLRSTLASIEKENLHPVTGQRAGPTMGSEAKKRKTAALATKVLQPPASKKHKELKAEPKKIRKPLSSAKPRCSDAKKSTSRASRSSRKAVSLPPLVEEQESLRQLPRLSIAQTDIDSRCYELTVSPLADVSEAYDPVRSESQEPDVHTEREKSAEPAVCDYFPSSKEALCTTDDVSRPVNDCSTPERQRVHSSFTFSSPSPTSERFKRTQMSPARHDALVSNQE